MMILKRSAWLALMAGIYGCSSPVTSKLPTDKSHWEVYGGSKSEQHYSPLSQIDTGNVKNLQVAWT
ncbi:MAG TPA: hypothetical protein VHC47_07745, partial [Mucilaginibacter sp.]|nr:hypothetical protein [Mucilaginibacter sp.]